jgi:hypothetical protein
VYGDFSFDFGPTGNLYYLDLSLDVAGPGTLPRQEFFLAPNGDPFGKFLKGFGEDEDGELYVCASGTLGPFGTDGVVYKIIPPTVAAVEGGAPRALTVSPGFNSAHFALRVTPDCPSGVSKYVGMPFGATNLALLVDNPGDAACLTSEEWGQPVHVSGTTLGPLQSYSVEVDYGCPNGPQALSASMTAMTNRNADVVSPFNPPSTTTQPDALDITSVVNRFKGLPGSPPIHVVDLFGVLGPSLCAPQGIIDAIDITAVVDAFKGFAYPCPTPCP